MTKAGATPVRKHLMHYWGADELRRFWSSGKPMTFKGKDFRVGKMSYGQYFLEPYDPRYPQGRGERESFSSDTMFLEKLKGQPIRYGVEDEPIGVPDTEGAKKRLARVPVLDREIGEIEGRLVYNQNEQEVKELKEKLGKLQEERRAYTVDDYVADARAVYSKFISPMFDVKGAEGVRMLSKGILMDANQIIGKVVDPEGKALTYHMRNAMKSDTAVTLKDAEASVKKYDEGQPYYAIWEDDEYRYGFRPSLIRDLFKREFGKPKGDELDNLQIRYWRDRENPRSASPVALDVRGQGYLIAPMIEKKK